MRAEGLLLSLGQRSADSVSVGSAAMMCLLTLLGWIEQQCFLCLLQSLWFENARVVLVVLILKHTITNTCYGLCHCVTESVSSRAIV